MAGSRTQQLGVGVVGGFPAEIDGTAQKREVSEEFEIINPWFTPFLSAIGSAQGSPGQNMKHEWVEPDLFKKTLTVSATTAATTAEGTITLSANDAYRAPLGGVYMNLTSSEFVRVTARASDSTLTVTRAVAGTSGATMAAGATLKFVGVVMYEGADTLYKAHPIKTFSYNYYQTIEQGFEVTKPMQTLDDYGMDQPEYDREDLMMTLKFSLETSIIEGKRYAGASATDPPMLGGIYDFCTSANGAYVTSLASAALTESAINTALRDRFDTVGSKNISTDIWVHAFLKQKIDSLYEDRIRTSLRENAGGGTIDKILTSFGQLDVHLSDNLKTDQLIMLDPSRLKVLYWPGMNWFEGDLPSAGLTYERQGMAGMFTLQDRAVQTQSKLTNISTSS